MIVVDEAAFVTVKAYLEVILPVAQGNNIVVIGLTTPLGQENPTTRLFDTKDETNQTIWRHIRIGQPCQACKERKILCNHNENATGAGLSKRKRRQYMHFYADVMHIAMREYQGTPGESGDRLFDKEHLEAMVRRHPHPISVAASFILLSIDPAQGGKCDWGLCACYYDIAANLQVILHLDAVHLNTLNPENIKNQILLTIRYLRNRHQHVSHIPILVACESAPKIIGNQVAFYISMLEEEGQINDVYSMYEIGTGSPGVPKTNLNTQQMVAHTQLLLDHDQVVFSEHFGTLTPAGGSSVDPCTLIKRKLISQLNNFQKREITTERADITPRFRIDGKAGNQDDDVAVAYIMNVYWYLTAIMSIGQKYNHVTKGLKKCVTPGISTTGSRSSQKRQRENHTFNPDEPVTTAEIQATSTVEKRPRSRTSFSERQRPVLN